MIQSYFQLRKKSLNKLLYGAAPAGERVTLKGDVRGGLGGTTIMGSRKRTDPEDYQMNAPQQSDTVESITNVIAQYIIFDRDVLFHFFENDDR